MSFQRAVADRNAYAITALQLLVTETRVLSVCYSRQGHCFLPDCCPRQGHACSSSVLPPTRTHVFLQRSAADRDTCSLNVLPSAGKQIPVQRATANSQTCVFPACCSQQWHMCLSSVMQPTVNTSVQRTATDRDKCILPACCRRQGQMCLLSVLPSTVTNVSFLRTAADMDTCSFSSLPPTLTRVLSACCRCQRHVCLNRACCF